MSHLIWCAYTRMEKNKPIALFFRRILHTSNIISDVHIRKEKKTWIFCCFKIYFSTKYTDQKYTFKMYLLV